MIEQPHDVGLVAALQILSAMKTSGKPLSRLARCWTRYPQLVANVKVRVKTPFEELDQVMDLVKQAEAEVVPLGGRVLLRTPFGSERLLLPLSGELLPRIC
jgi:phosphoglucosamine mutase